jgi:glycosyltransferase involved in cell wall biosynthesis
MNEPPLRILHLTAGSDAGGLSRYIYDLSTAMVARGHEVAIAGEHGAWKWFFDDAPMPWVDVPLKGGPLALANGKKTLERWLEKKPVDLFHSHYRRPNLVARKLQKRFNIPILYTIHLSDLKLTWPWRLFSDFGDHTHVASAEARRWAIEEGRVAPENVTLIHHGIDASKFALADDATRRAARERLNLPLDAKVAGFVGRFDKPKNEQWLVDLAARMPGLHVLMTGEGPRDAELRFCIAREGVLGRVHLLGPRDPLTLYQAADALLLPSYREGFSLVCAEAMSVGTPILRTRTAGTAELVIENVTGRSTPIDHEAFLAAAVEFLSLPKDELRMMGVAGSEHVRKNYTFERQLEQTLALYRRLVTLNRDARR